jgi:nicotinamidase-related amidase
MTQAPADATLDRWPCVDVPPIQVSAEDTALLVVGMQYHHAHRCGSFVVAANRVAPASMGLYVERVDGLTVPSIARLLELWRSRRFPVVHAVIGAEDRGYADLTPQLRSWVRDLEERSGVPDILWTGNPDFAIRVELEPAPGEAVVRTTTLSAFTGSDLGEQLTGLCVSNLVIVGVATSGAVESTAREAADRGYGCLVVDFATADHSQAAHDAALQSLSHTYARVVTTADDVIRACTYGRPL